MGLTRAEQETVIQWDEQDKTVSLFSSSPTVWRKLARLGVPERRSPSTLSGTPVGRFYSVPLARFRWGLKRGGTGNTAALARFRQSTGKAPEAQTGNQP